MSAAHIDDADHTASTDRGRARAVRDAYASAVIAIRRPSIIFPGAAAVAAFSVLMVYGRFLSASRPGGSRLTDPPTYLSDLADPQTLADLAGGVVMITGACVLSIAAAHMAAPFVSGSVRIQLVRQPRRLVWLAGNLLAVTVLTCALTVLAVAAVVVSAFVVGPAYGVPVDAWTSSDSARELARTTANLAGCLVGFAMLGAALAVRLRSAIATIGFGLTYGLFEGLISAVLPDAARFAPAQNLSALAQGGTNEVPYAWALIATVGVITATVAYAGYVLTHRDVDD